ncbi:MAG: hypothetical protein LUG60_03810 [Erysipelotrichaceae bacterium]|nr:hypothetical protein [Erysipelotrichaceae bacterium]
MYKKILSAFVVIFMIVLLYCCYPYSLNDIIDIDSVESLYGSVVVMNIDDEGNISQNTYETPTLNSSDNEFNAIINILQSTTYQQHLSNLFLREAISTTDVNQSVVITLCSHNEIYTLYLLNNIVYIETDSYKTYHMTSNVTTEKLIKYVANSMNYKKI